MVSSVGPAPPLLFHCRDLFLASFCGPSRHACVHSYLSALNLREQHYVFFGAEYDTLRSDKCESVMAASKVSASHSIRRKSLQHHEVRTNSKPSVDEHHRLLQATTPHPAHKTQQFADPAPELAARSYSRKAASLAVMSVAIPTFKNAQTTQSREPKWAGFDLTKKSPRLID